jgi:tripartite-type tricarboxylate transporter receptor subunit TctC
MIEQGYPEIQGDTWVGIMAPKGTPDKIVTSINQEIGEYLQQPAARQRLADVGFDVVNKGPAEFALLMNDEMSFWKQVADETKVKVD